MAVVPTSEWAATAEGLVLDRSAGGLCVAVERPYREGDEVYLWVEGAAAGFTWVGVVVRNCRDCGGYVLLGCEFQQSLPLAVRLQFGCLPTGCSFRDFLYLSGYPAPVQVRQIMCGQPYPRAI